MRRAILCLSISALWALPTLAAEPALTAKRLGEDVYELTLTTDQTADVSQAQRAMYPAAQELCARKRPTLGRYKFESAEPMPGQPSARPSITLRQEIRCVSASQPPSTGAPAAPIAHDDATIEKLSLAFLAAKDTGKYSEAYASLSDSMKASTSFDSWSSNVRSFNAKAGKVKRRSIKKVTWYDNPPSAPTPGIYAAADYASDFENLSVHCGYVVWIGLPDNSFRIVREEENFIDKEADAKLRPDRKREFIERFGC